MKNKYAFITKMSLFIWNTEFQGREGEEREGKGEEESEVERSSPSDYDSQG